MVHSLDVGGKCQTFADLEPLDKWAEFNAELNSWEPIPSLVWRRSNIFTGANCPYARDVRVVTWNSQCLFGADVVKSERKILVLCKLMSNNDVVMVQETRDDYHKRLYFEQRFGGTHSFFWNSVEGGTFGGTLICVKKSFMLQFNNVSHVVLIDGRIQQLTLDGNFGNLSIINTHIDPMLTNNQICGVLDTVLANVKDVEHYHTIIAGDFNFELNANDRITLANGHFCGRVGQVARHWVALFGAFSELFQPEYTRSALVSTPAGTASRIDRIYTSLRPFILNDLLVTINTIGTLFNTTGRLSDHIPVAGSFKMFRPSSFFRNRIPNWVCSHPFYPNAIDIAAKTTFVDIDLNDPFVVHKTA